MPKSSRMRLLDAGIGAIVLLSCACAVRAQDTGPAAIPAPAIFSVQREIDGIDFGYRPLAGPSGIQDLNFYLLTLFEQTPEALRILLADPDLAAIRRDAASRLRASAAACEAEGAAAAKEGRSTRQVPDCAPGALRLTDAERQRSAEAVGRLYDRSPVVRRLVTDHMRPSGRFQRDAALDDRALLVKAWTEALSAIDRIIRVYALMEKPRYADIDSPIYVPGASYGAFLGYDRSLLPQLIRETARRIDAPDPAYGFARDFALELMEVNGRIDAVRQLALQEKENAPAYAYAADVKWTDYPYAAILVNGSSPWNAYEPLGPMAIYRMRRGVELFRAGRAPVIIVSGGRLRPVGTERTEALEMKRYLMTRFGIPENRILIDALARHTTTNLRNAGRMIFRIGAPADKKSLLAGVGQDTGILSEAFKARCERDFGYVPFIAYSSLGSDALEFRPVLTVLHREATDPMDP